MVVMYIKEYHFLPNSLMHVCKHAAVGRGSGGGGVSGGSDGGRCCCPHACMRAAVGGGSGGDSRCC